MAPDGARVVASRLDARLSSSVWDVAALDQAAEPQPEDVSAATEVALFALKLSGKRRQARRGGRLGQLVRSFALAACVALASAAAACSNPSSGPEATQVAISQLPLDSASSAVITSPARAGPAFYSDLLLLDAGTDAQPWAIAVPAGGGDAPILVDRVGSGLDTPGTVYKIAAQPVVVGTRDGVSQFLDPLQPAESIGSGNATSSVTRDRIVEAWHQDERYLAAARAVAGQPIVLDAAYNAESAAAAGGTHTYVNGVVLRVEPDSPVLQVIDRALLESALPTRAEDVVYVAIRSGERALYEPGQVVNLRDVVMERQNTDVNGQPTTIYTANAALNGARVEPTGSVDLQSLLQPRLQRVDQDLTVQSQELGLAAPAAGATPQPAATATAATAVQPVVVNNNGGYRGPSFIDDFLIWTWLSHSGYYRGSTVIINNPPSYAGRSGSDTYYSPPPTAGGSGPSTVAAAQSASRSTALQAARTSISGQSSGTGGGVAATNKSAADSTARVSAATSKAASVASNVSSSSVGKSVSSVPSSASSTASRSAGSTSAGARGSAGVSSRSGSSSSGSSGGKGISGSGGSSGFGGKGSSGGGSSSS